LPHLQYAMRLNRVNKTSKPAEKVIQFIFFGESIVVQNGTEDILFGNVFHHYVHWANII